MIDLKELKGTELEFLSEIKGLIADGCRIRDFEGRYDFVKERISAIKNIKGIIIQGQAPDVEKGKEMVNGLTEDLGDIKVFWFMKSGNEDKINVDVYHK
ncbi:hypothetical protein J4427_01615 [Candidatus Woesearchaeota archaeon]|nr:hypothetical protein [Candidatus Woesearchaeota archaeon]